MMFGGNRLTKSAELSRQIEAAVRDTVNGGDSMQLALSLLKEQQELLAPPPFKFKKKSKK